MPKSTTSQRSWIVRAAIATSCLASVIAMPSAIGAAGATPKRAAAAPREEFPVPAGFTSAFKTVDGVRLHYVRGGSGPLVLMVHGFGQAWYEWHQLMPLLAKTNTVVAVDLPGLGLSSAPASYVGQNVAETLYRFAKGLSPSAPFDIVAHDIGDWNTYPLVVRHQSDVRRYVYMEAPIPDESIYSLPAFSPQGESLAWHFSFFSAKNGLPERLIGGNERFFFEHFIKEHATNTAAITPSFLDMYARSYAKPQTLHSAMEYYRALNATAKGNMALRSTKLTMPVLAVGGGGHGGIGQAIPDQVKKYADNVTPLVMPNCGHWLTEECAAPLNAAIVGFLAQK